MPATKYLRFATYALLFGSLFVATKPRRFIPLSLNSPRWLAAEAALAQNQQLVEDATVLDCARSGSDVLSKANRLLDKHHLTAYCAPVPRVSLRKTGHQVQWILTYRKPDPAPGDFYSVTIIVDDLTGECSFAPR